MIRFEIVLIFVQLFLTSPAPAQQAKDNPSAQAMPLCAVIADAAKYDGKEIMVRGLYRMVIHGAILMDRACSKTDVSLRDSPGYKADKKAASVLRSITKKDQFQPVEVVFRGIFRVAQKSNVSDKSVQATRSKPPSLSLPVLNHRIIGALRAFLPPICHYMSRACRFAGAAVRRCGPFTMPPSGPGLLCWVNGLARPWFMADSRLLEANQDGEGDDSHDELSQVYE